VTDVTQESTSSPSWRQPIEARKQRAEYYFNFVLDNQQRWYSDKAGGQKFRYLFFAIIVIVLGALISILQIYSDQYQFLVSRATAILGATVSVLRSIDTLLRPQETWQAYRKASEGLKKEYRLYLNNADAYAKADSEDAAYRLFVERVEMVIAEEQQLYWQFQISNQRVSGTSGSDNDDLLTDTHSTQEVIETN
jgi:hypothetical protein